MDIAKIRKKAREKEKGEKPTERRDETAEDRVEGPSAGEGTDNGVTDVPPEVHEDAEEPAGEDTGKEAVSAASDDAAAVLSEEPGEPPDAGELPAEDAGNVIELLSFAIAGKEFAFRIDNVEEIIPYHGITCVPLLPGYVSGIMSLRGKIIPVIDLRSRFSIEEKPHEPSSPDGPPSNGREKILILSGSKGLIGATVDSIRGVVRCTEDSVLDPPAHLTEQERRFIEGVVIQEKRFISVVRFGDALNIEVG